MHVAERTFRLFSFRESLHQLGGISAFSSLLMISSKYDFHDLRSDLVQHLEQLFPDNWKVFAASRIHGRIPQPILLFELLVAAHRCEVLSILPSLYYLCARIPLELSIETIQTLPKDIAKSIKSTTLKSHWLKHPSSPRRRSNPCWIC